MGEIKDAQKTEGVICQTHIGGQALIEGVMMRGRYNWAVAVRQPDGTIYTEEHDLASGKDKNRWLYWPIIRGCTALVESLVLGYKALGISANHAYEFDEDDDADAELAEKPEAGGELPGKGGQGAAAQVLDSSNSVSEKPAPDSAEAASDDKEDGPGMGEGAMAVSMVLGIVLGIAVFIVAPAALTNLIMGDYGQHTFAWNLVDGLLRVAIFIGYIWAISLMKDIKRMFSYHGAEHKTIHCFEHGLPLTSENADQFPRLHVRCGTAFLIVTMIIAILVFTLMPVNGVIDGLGITSGAGKLGIVILSRIVLMPLVAALAYEVTVKWAGAHPEKPLVKVLLWPGMQMQRLTTNQPDKGMLECAIAAMELVIAREKAEAAAKAAPDVRRVKHELEKGEGAAEEPAA